MTVITGLVFGRNGIVTGLLLALVALCSPTAEAAMARSDSYSLEYAVTGAGAGSAESQGGDYSMVGLVTTDGAAGTSASSSDYSVGSVVGGSEPGVSSVGEWMLY